MTLNQTTKHYPLSCPQLDIWFDQILHPDAIDSPTEPTQFEQAFGWIKQEFIKPFQLYQQVLFQFALCKAEKLRSYWLIKYHYLIIDKWTISLMVQYVAAAYNALTIRH